jgi:hypothetical protein
LTLDYLALAYVAMQFSRFWLNVSSAVFFVAEDAGLMLIASVELGHSVAR